MSKWELRFDAIEYATQYLNEVKFLESKGIKSCFTKANEFGIRTYKYKKNYELFVALSDFYKQFK